MPSTVSNDANTIMPLLFAAHPEIVPNYRRMAAMDDLGRTDSALEHKFRVWRQDGKKILAEKGDVDNVKSVPNEATSVPKKAVSVRGGAGSKSNIGKSMSHKPVTAKKIEDEEAIAEEDAAADAHPKAEVNVSKAKLPKIPHQDPKKADSILKNLKARKGEKVANASTVSSRKRAAPTDLDTGGEAVKKPRIAKKGIAKKVKKPTPKPRETDEEVTSSDNEEGKEEAEEADEGKKKPVGKGTRARSNAVSYPEPKVPEGVKDEEEPEDNTAEELVEMRFDPV